MFKRMMQIAAAVVLAVPVLAAEWMTDLAAAKERAAAEGKLVLLEFTGSGWCYWCGRLHSDVLDTPEFESYARDKFVLVQVDLPRPPDMTAPPADEKQRLCQEYRVYGYPNILVLHPQGYVVGGFAGYRRGLDEARKPLDAAVGAARAIRLALEGPLEQRVDLISMVYRDMESNARSAAGMPCVVADAEDEQKLRAAVLQRFCAAPAAAEPARD